MRERKSRVIPLSLGIGGLLWGIAAHGLNEPQLDQGTSVSSLNEVPRLSKDSKVLQGAVDLSLVQYLSFPAKDSRSQVRPVLQGVAFGQTKDRNWMGAYDFGVWLSPIRMETYGSEKGQVHWAGGPWTVHAPELYLGYAPSSTGWADSPIQLYTGRKVEHWSRMDESWKLGLWSPLFKWDCLAPEEQGLVGEFLHLEEPGFQVVLLGSPLFIPDQGPSYDLSNGKFTTDSPCFDPPQNNLVILKQNTDIRYQINMPSLAKVLFNPGVSSMVRVGQETGPWVKAAYAYLPLNRIILAFDGYLQLNQSQAQVEITPLITYHHLATLEAGVEGERLSGWVSVLYDRPLPAEYPPNLTAERVTPSVSAGPALSWRLSDRHGEPSQLSLSYLKVWAGYVTTDGPLACQGVMTESYYAYRDAVSLGIQTPLWKQEGNDWRLSSRLVHDFSVDGNFLSSELRYYPKPRLSFGLEMDLLGVGTGVNDSSTLISRFKGDDRVQGGARYVF